jgi:hypothetical protein
MADFNQIANELANDTSSDVILVNASMERGAETKFIDAVLARKRRENAIVIVVTNGGDADVAYRIARCLQNRYKKITALVPGQCKSAGTLLIIGAHEIAFSDHGELGPLDVQLRKADDMWTSTSGLTVMNAFSALQSKSEEAFSDFALSIKARSGVTYKTAADIASKLTGSLFGHIYQQIEVMHVGEAARAMKIAEEYGQRLDRVTDNLRGGALSTLIASYPSHGFVIDMKEAQTLFKQVRELSEKERELCDELGTLARDPNSKLQPVYYLSDPPPAVKAAANDQQGTDPTNPAGQGTGAQGSVEQAAPAASAIEAPGAQVIPINAGSAGG